MNLGAIVVAAGRGLRAGGALPKQYQRLGDRPVLQVTLEALAASPLVATTVVVLHPEDADRFVQIVRVPGTKPIVTAMGGATRSASVRAGLAALPPDCARVLIHDAARPLVTGKLIERVARALDRFPGAAPALPVTDALWQGSEGRVTGSRDRDGLYRAQTPQGFHTRAIVAAHAAHAGDAADDVEVARAFGLDVVIVEGDEDNIKITHPEDLARAAAILRKREGHALDIRTGNGFDVHSFGPGTSVTLCGMAIPHDRGLVGHSDADVGMHAITDAIYGALSDGDIGRHFPPSDPQWKGAASRIFLEHATGRAVERGYRITNVDCTLICEKPKIGPHAIEMQGTLEGIMGLEAGRVSVKATTSERLGFTGREEGIAAIATVTLVRP